MVASTISWRGLYVEMQTGSSVPSKLDLDLIHSGHIVIDLRLYLKFSRNRAKDDVCLHGNDHH